jgi:hypothetical protein
MRGVTVDPAFRTLIPPDTSTLSGMEWDALKASPFYQRHQHDLNIPAFNAAVEHMGINPLRDLSNLLVASNATDYLFMERGRFNADDLQKRIVSGGARETTYKGHKVLGNATGAMVFFKSVALEGDDAAVRRAIDLESAGEGEVPEELAERLRTLDKRDQIWTVSRAGLAYANLPMKADISSALANITGSISGTTAGIYVDSGFHLSIELQCKSDAGATRVHDALRGLIGFGRLSTRDNEQDLLRAYDSIQVDKSDQTVKVRTDLSGDVADKLLDSVLALKHSH